MTATVICDRCRRRQTPRHAREWTKFTMRSADSAAAPAERDLCPPCTVLVRAALERSAPHRAPIPLRSVRPS